RRIDGAKARIGSEAEAHAHEEALRGERFTVQSVTRSERRKSAPPPFTTSTLQQEASRKLGFGASRTMRAAQSLYEGIALAEGQVGLITYMRTDSVAIASGAVAEARQVINSRYGEAFVPKRPNTYRTRTRGAQEAHEAIRPSNFARTPDALRDQLKPDEFRLYELIWKRALASQMAPARFDQVGVDVAAGRYTLHAGAAKRVTDLLVEHFPEVVDLDFTARMEEQLDDVARGTNAWVPMVRGFWEPFNEKLVEGRTKIAKQVELTDIVCPVSGDFMVKRFGRNGWFLGCSAYPECKHTMPLPGEEPETPPDMPGVGEVCPLCGEGHLVARRGRYGPFVGCDRYPDCRYIKKDATAPSEQF